MWVMLLGGTQSVRLRGGDLGRAVWEVRGKRWALGSPALARGFCCSFVTSKLLNVVALSLYAMGGRCVS